VGGEVGGGRGRGAARSVWLQLVSSELVGLVLGGRTRRTWPALTSSGPARRCQTEVLECGAGTRYVGTQDADTKAEELEEELNLGPKVRCKRWLLVSAKNGRLSSRLATHAPAVDCTLDSLSEHLCDTVIEAVCVYLVDQRCSWLVGPSKWCWDRRPCLCTHR
jgi:hypothetical protein